MTYRQIVYILLKKVKGRTTKRKHPPQKATQPFPMVHALVKYRESLTKR